MSTSWQEKLIGFDTIHLSVIHMTYVLHSQKKRQVVREIRLFRELHTGYHGNIRSE